MSNEYKIGRAAVSEENQQVNRDEQTELQLALKAQQQQLTELANTINKLSRTQFKTNTLVETQQEQAKNVLAQLQEALLQQEAEHNNLVNQYQEKLATARAKMATELLPVLDGIEAAIEHTPKLASPSATNGSSTKPANGPGDLENFPPNFWQRLYYLFNPQKWPVFVQPAIPEPCVEVDSSQQQAAWNAWVVGLKIIQERFLKLLALEEIYPFASVGEIFDPRWHIALEAVENAQLPNGQIIAVTRKGYRQGERVLRYAEVTVNRKPK